MADTFKVTSVVTVNDNPIDENSRRIRLQPKSKNNIAKNIRNVPVKPEVKEVIENKIEEKFNDIEKDINTVNKADELAKDIFENIKEPAVAYDVNTPLTTEESNMINEEKPAEMPIVEATPIMPVPTTEVPQNIDEISDLTDKLNDTLKLEAEEKTRAEETRIKYNLAEEEKRKVSKEFDELKENIERNIEASNERIRQYREVSNEMDKKTMDTLNETAKMKELVAKMRLINNGDNQNTMTEDYQKRMAA